MDSGFFLEFGLLLGFGMGEISAYMFTCRQHYLKKLPLCMFLAPRTPKYPRTVSSQRNHTALKLLLLLSPAVVKKKKKNQKNTGFWASLVVQCLRLCTSAAGGVDSIPSQGLTKNLQTKKKNRGIPSILTGNQRNISTFFCFPFLILLPLICFS